jgi:hypothetical protein
MSYLAESKDGHRAPTLPETYSSEEQRKREKETERNRDREKGRVRQR